MRSTTLALMVVLGACGVTRASEHVIIVSIDGLRPAAIETLGAAGAPNFHRMQREGVWTHNARTDHDWTYTVPNNSSMVTARAVEGELGHNYTSNANPDTNTTYHSVKRSYVPSLFDVAHDHGHRTGFYYSKSKLVIIDQSYSASTGAPDLIGDDDGPDKIDVAKSNFVDDTSDELTLEFVGDLLTEKFALSFLHLVDPDRAGHGDNWTTPGYLSAVSAIDGYLGQIITAIESDPALAETTVMIVTTDHGGAGSVHSVPSDPENFIIPFYVWGTGVKQGGDLYNLNADTRLDPGLNRVHYRAPLQPIRNADCANLALGLLELPPVPSAGATINASQDLKVTEAAPMELPLTVTRLGNALQLTWENLGAGSNYTVELFSGSDWEEGPGIWPTSEATWTDPDPIEETRLYRVVATAMP